MFTSEVNWMCLRRSKGGQGTSGFSKCEQMKMKWERVGFLGPGKTFGLYSKYERASNIGMM